jgi:hypothetical protein
MQARMLLPIVATLLMAGGAEAQQPPRPVTPWQQVGVFECTGQQCTVSCADKSYERVRSAALVQSQAGGQAVLSLFDADAKVIAAVLVAGEMCHFPGMGFTPVK